MASNEPCEICGHDKSFLAGTAELCITCFSAFQSLTKVDLIIRIGKLTKIINHARRGEEGLMEGAINDLREYTKEN